MTLPLHFPAPIYVPKLALKAPTSVAALCAQAGVPCAATGAWTARCVELRSGTAMMIEAEPGYLGAVRVTIPRDYPQPAKLALGALAYSLFDGVARASIAGKTWAKPAVPRGRTPSGKALSNSERQRRWRQRQRPTSI